MIMEKNFVLVMNCGSSSVKFSVINPINDITIIDGVVENISTDFAVASYKIFSKKKKYNLGNISFKDAIGFIIRIIKSKTEIYNSLIGVGHRVVHGGEYFKKSVILDKKAINKIRLCIDLAPLHNPANLDGIINSIAAFQKIPHIGVFDTAFHHSIPDFSYIYATPYYFYEKYSIRRYGFHGISHFYVSRKVAQLIEKKINLCNFITVHLGNGCSITSIQNGKSIDTSMGFTPLEGVPMGTRSGDIDAGIIEFISNKESLKISDIINQLNNNSGLFGISGKFSDMRELIKGYEDGCKRCKLAINVFSYKCAKYIMALLTRLKKLDGIIFTGGIGENSFFIREKIVSYLSFLNIKLDKNNNYENGVGSNHLISKKNGKIKVFVIPTREDLVIAKDCFELISQKDSMKC